MKFGYHSEFNIHQKHQNHTLQEIYILELELKMKDIIVYIYIYIYIYTDSYYFDENNRVTWAIQYDLATRTLSVPDNWINAYCDGVKFTPNKIISIWCRKFK